MPEGESAVRQPRISRWSIALSAGLAIGALVVAAYGFSIRIPDGGRSTATTHSASSLLTGSLVLAVVAALAAIGLGWWALSGGEARPYAAALLAGTVLVTGYAYLNSAPARAASALSGPGAHPAVSLAQLAWPLLAAAALLLLFGTAWSEAGGSAFWAGAAFLSPMTGLGIALSVAAGLIVVTRWDAAIINPATVASTSVPSFPERLGTDVAYTVAVEEAEHVLPAGPGFVVYDDNGGIQAYDGTTGDKRWRVGSEALPDHCELRDVRSTGTTMQSVVVAQCVRPKRLLDPNAQGDHSVLVGIDANTGQVLWLNDDDFALGSGAGQSDSIVVVSREPDIGALDPRTGAVRWVKPGASSPCEGRGDVVHDEIVLVPCFRGNVLRVLNGGTGAEREIALDALPAEGSTDPYGFAAAGDTLVIRATIDRSRPGVADTRNDRDFVTLAVDVPGNTVTTVPSAVGNPTPHRPLPGALLQLASGGGRDDRYVEVFAVAERRLARVTGVGEPYPSAGDGRVWASIGDAMVTAGAKDSTGGFLAVVDPKGSVQRRESPCRLSTDRYDSAGVLPVPGATLILCPPPQTRVRGWTVIGLR